MKSTRVTYVLLFCLLHMFMVVAQSKPTLRIGVLLDNNTPRLEGLRQQLVNEVTAVVGEDATVIFPNNAVLANDLNLEKAKANYATLVNGEVDLILAFGVINNEVISPLKNFAKPTILFGAVNKDLTPIDLSKATSGVENFTFLVSSESYEEDLGKFKELSNFQNVGIAVEAAILEVLPLQETFDRELKELQADYKLLPFTSASDILNNLEGVDAIYMAGGFAMDKAEKKRLADAFVQQKLPSFTIGGANDVQLGFMATLRDDGDLNQFFRRIALNVESFVNGTPLSELPVYIEYTSRLTINYNTAEAVGVPIKYSLIGETDFIGEVKNVRSEKQYDLLTAIDQALQENLSINSIEKDVELAQQDVKTAKSNYLPAVTAAGTASYIDPDLAEISNGQNPEFSTGGNITLNQTLFSEAANANIFIQKRLQKAQEENLNASELDLVFDVANAYFTTLTLKANTEIQVRNVELTKSNLEIAEQNFQAGQSGKSDMLRFESEMAQNTQSMVEAINQLEQAFLVLNQLLNNPADYEIDVDDVDFGKGIFEQYDYDDFFEILDNPTLRDPFIDFLVQEAKGNAPELRSLGYNLEATERNVRLNGSGRFLPTLALQGQYNATFNRSGAGSTAPMGFGLVDNYYTAGLNLSIPIINQNLNNINRQSALIQKEQLGLNKENLELNISVNIRNGVLNMINQISNIELSTVSEKTAKEALELNQVSYSNGAINIVQLLDSQTNYLNAQLARANAVYNFLLNSLQLERYLGYYFLLNSEEENNAFRQRFFDYLNNQK